MQDYLNSLTLVLLTIVIVGCNRSSQQPISPTLTPTPQISVAQMNAESRELATPTSQLAASSPILAPTITSAPLATATPTSSPYTRYNAVGTSIVVTPIPVAPLVTCTSEEAVITCYDELLDMNFSYPESYGADALHYVTQEFRYWLYL